MRATAVHFLVAAGALLAAAGSTPAASTPQEGAPLDIWSDPEFQKQFLGSYGVLAEQEPKLSAVEREQLEKLLPLMGSDPDAAAAELQKLATPESSALFDYTLGNIRFQQDRLDEAAGHYAIAVQKFPSFRRAHKNLGMISVRQGNFDDAIRSLTRVVELGGADSLTFGLLGYAYTAKEQFLSAESAYRQAVLLEPQTLDWKLGLTQAVLRQKKFAEAATLSEELIARYPDRSDFWLLQANAFIGQGQYLRAAENFEIVARMGKANAATLQTLGDIYVNEQMWDLAAAAYGRAVELEPQTGVQRALRSAEVLSQRGALAQARELIGTVKANYGSQLVEEDRRKLLKLEARIAVAEGAGGDAVGVLEELIAIDPLDGEALLLLGQHYARSNDPERAIFYYERAASLEQFEADAKVRQAQVLVSQARYREAVPLLRRAQEIRPRDDVGRYLEEVERFSRTQR